MAICNGCSPDANDVAYALIKYQGVNNAQNFINAMKVASPGVCYPFIKGLQFCCNQGNAVIEFDGHTGGGSYLLCNTNYLDAFTNAGCACTTSPSCDLGPLTYTSHTTLNSYCTDGTTLTVASCGASCAVANTCLALCNGRAYADCYRFCVGMSATTDNGNNVSVLRINFGGCCLCYCSANAPSIAMTLYELRKISGTDSCYCYLKAGSLICCFSPPTNGGLCFVLDASCKLTCGQICFCTCFCATYTTSPKIRTCCLTFAETLDYVAVGAHITPETNSCLRYDVLCSSTNAVMCCCLCFNTAYSMSTCAKTTYKIQMYDACICTLCNTSPAVIQGFAFTGISRCPQ